MSACVMFVPPTPTTLTFALIFPVYQPVSTFWRRYCGAPLILCSHCFRGIFCWKQMSAESGKDADVSNGSTPKLLSFMQLNKCGQFVTGNGTFYITPCTIYNINNM